MGSRLMHLIIAYKIAERCKITDRDSFVLGGLAPDAVSPKDLSHYYEGHIRDNSRRINGRGFLHKYSSMYQPYILGYYTHLVADQLWLSGFYFPWLKKRMESDPSIHTLYHEDFRMLNPWLIDYYDIRDVLVEVLESEGRIEDLEEVASGDVIDFLPAALEDLRQQSGGKKRLDVFSFEQIIGYIETSVDKGAQAIQEVGRHQ
ncbi:hydrolase [Halobacillus locisalis]|uniref:Hydrolase n=1 Tax=Halobacillus locisalis TaxID=220753 RepID=A0A838CPA5_9BACI|nr:hydrolase [Halobacillus locisalis]MBA2173723.1 hydrolase [Halobacillus locisalis]